MGERRACGFITMQVMTLTALCILGCGKTEWPWDKAPTGNVMEIPMEYTFVAGSDGSRYNFLDEDDNLFANLYTAFNGMGQKVLICGDSVIVPPDSTVWEWTRWDEYRRNYKHCTGRRYWVVALRGATEDSVLMTLEMGVTVGASGLSEPGVDSYNPPTCFLLYDNTEWQERMIILGKRDPSLYTSIPALWSQVAIHEMGHARANLRDLTKGMDAGYHRDPQLDGTGMGCVMNNPGWIGYWGMSADSQWTRIQDRLSFCGSSGDRCRGDTVKSCFRYIDQRVKGAAPNGCP